MSIFHDILSKLEDKFKKETNRCEEIAEVLTTVLGTKVEGEQVVHKGTIIKLNVLPTLKMAVKMKEGRIISALKDKGIDVDTIR